MTNFPEGVILAPTDDPDEDVAMSAPPANGPQRSTPKGDLQIAKALDAAEELIRKNEPLTLRAVAKAVGISVGNLQYYFPTRGKLIEALFERYATDFRAERAAIIDGVDQSRDQLILLVDYWLMTELRPEQALFWHLWSISAYDDSARETMDAIYGRLITFLAKHLRVIHPGLTAAHATRRAGSIVALIEGSGLMVGYKRVPTGAIAGLQREIRAAAIEIIDRPPSPDWGKVAGPRFKTAVRPRKST